MSTLITLVIVIAVVCVLVWLIIRYDTKNKCVRVEYGRLEGVQGRTHCKLWKVDEFIEQIKKMEGAFT